MNREEKDVQIQEVSKVFAAAAGVYLVNTSGLTVVQVTDLRRRIKAAKGACKVVKNRLAIRGAKGTAAESLGPFFKGPISIVSHPTEPISLAKVLTDFAKDHPAVTLRAAVVDGDLVDADAVKVLATLPGLNELRSMLVGVIAAPASRLARVIAAPGQQLARVVDARRKQLGE